MKDFLCIFLCGKINFLVMEFFLLPAYSCMAQINQVSCFLHYHLLHQFLFLSSILITILLNIFLSFCFILHLFIHWLPFSCHSFFWELFSFFTLLSLDTVTFMYSKYSLLCLCLNSRRSHTTFYSHITTTLRTFLFLYFSKPLSLILHFYLFINV